MLRARRLYAVIFVEPYASFQISNSSVLLEISLRFSQKKVELPFTSVIRPTVAAMKKITSFPS